MDHAFKLARAPPVKRILLPFSRQLDEEFRAFTQERCPFKVLSTLSVERRDDAATRHTVQSSLPTAINKSPINIPMHVLMVDWPLIDYQVKINK